MLKTLKNYQILDLMDAFVRIGQMEVSSTKMFSYALLLNDAELSPKVKVIMDIAKPSEKYEEYSSKRNDVIAKYAELDDDGNAVVSEDGNYVQISEDNLDIAKEELDALVEEYSDVIQKREDEAKEYNDILDLDVEVDLTTVSIEDVPDEVGTDIRLMKMLMPIIG